MRVIVTRPGDDGKNLAQLLSDNGVEAIIEPLFNIQTHPTKELSLEKVQAYLVTSTNGLKALNACVPNYTIPLFAVGDATALTARNMGFKVVHSSSGNVNSLANLVKEILKPANGSLLYATTAIQAGNLQEDLEKLGFQCQTEILYETIPIKSFSTQTISKI